MNKQKIVHPEQKGNKQLSKQNHATSSSVHPGNKHRVRMTTAFFLCNPKLATASHNKRGGGKKIRDLIRIRM